MRNKNKIFVIAGFDDCFLDGWSWDSCFLRWFLNLNKSKLMAILLFLSKSRLMVILLALNKPKLMAIYFLYNQDILI